MNEQEKQFLESIRNKIKKYSIGISEKEAIDCASDQFSQTQYNDGSIELIDMGIEYKLCSLSPYYFIDRYSFIPFPRIGIIPFKLYYFQQEILKEINNLKKVVFLKSRQVGISSLFALYCLWRCLFLDAESIDVVSLKLNKAQEFVGKMKPTMDRLPPFINKKLEIDNSQKLKWENSSQIVSEPASERAGRSDTLSFLVLDEVAHYLSNRLTRGIVAAAIPTLTRTGGSLALLSTPCKTAGSGAYYYEQVTQLQLEGNSSTEKLIEVGWYEVPDIKEILPYKSYNTVLQKYIDKDYYNNPVIQREMKKFFEPISKDWKNNEWLRKQYKDLGPVLYAQEILHSFVVSGNQVFSEDILKRLEECAKEPIEVDKLGKKGAKGLWIWKRPIPKKRYIFGVDISSGTGSDTSTIEVFDVEEYEQVCEFKGFISTPAFGRLIKSLARYYNEAFIVIECNGIGEAVFNEIYYHDTDSYTNVYKQKKTKNGITRMTGYTSDSKTRRLLTNDLIDWLAVDELWEELKIYSSRIWDEAKTWIWEGNKPIHETGAHDDILIALALALYFRNKATEAGTSFLINEDGDFIEYSSKDKIDDDKVNDTFEFLTSDGYTEDDYLKEKIGMDKEHYDFLIGNKR